jgi:hypothetical protein
MKAYEEKDMKIINTPSGFAVLLDDRSLVCYGFHLDLQRAIKIGR